jgi:hypothetical protein
LEEAGGRYKNIWLDDLIFNLGSVVKIEQVNNAAFLQRCEQAFYPSHLTTTLLDVLGALLRRVRQPPIIAALAQDLGAVLRAELGDEALTYATIRSILAAFYWRKRLWALILSRVKPRIILVTNPGEFGLTAAAKSHGAQVIEIQHGIVDEFHPSYSLTTAALPYRTSMPIPDLLFLHGEHWRQELSKRGFWGNALRVVGNPHVDLYRRPGSERGQGQARRVVFTSQGIATDMASDLLAGCLEELRGRSEINLIVKMHPVYDADTHAYEEKLAVYPNVSLYKSNEGPSTFALLASADVHISISSATHYNALALGVPTIVLKLPRYETVLPLIEKGYAKAVSNARQLADLLVSEASLNVAPMLSEYFCKPGAVDNMLKEVRSLSPGAGLA